MAGRHQEQAGGTGVKDRRRALSGLPEQPVQEPIQGCLVASVQRRGRGRVEVDPRVAGEIANGGPGVEQRMILVGDDAGGRVEEWLATQECRQRLAGVVAAAM